MLYLCGTDCADVDIREKLALSSDDIKNIYKKINMNNDISGFFILSTCNRTEVYVSADENADVQPIFDLVFKGYEKFCRYHTDKNVVEHIFKTACGLNSLIKRETQIITQISDAEKTARELGTLDSELEVLIRTALSTAKKASGINTYDIRINCALLAANWLESELVSLKDKKCLVIGNGNIGILAAKTLRDKGADVTMTLRSRSDSVVPKGCKAIAYDMRYENEYDILVSATKSPHYTVVKDKLKFYPKFIADLALPRDISPEVREEYGKNYRCIDDFKTSEEDDSSVLEIIEEGMNEFYLWKNYRESLGVIDEIKELITNRLSLSCDVPPEHIADTVSRTADMLLCGFKENVTPETAKTCLERLTKRARL